MNTIIFPLKRQMRGPQVADLQDALRLLLERGLLLANDEGARRELLQALQREQAEQLYGGATAKLVARFQEERHLQPTGEVDERTAEALNALLKELGVLDQPPQPGPRSYRVEGKVTSRTSASIGDLRVVIVDKGVGGDLPLAEATTDPEGRYQAGFTDERLRQRGKDKPDVQVRVFLGEGLLGASEVRYNASEQETLDVLLDEKSSATLPSEYETLTGALASHFFRGRLAGLEETDDRQDITYLANKTGWDARAVALASLADQFSAWATNPTGAPGIPPHFFYALFRTGLPANEDVLYHADPKTLEAVWKQAAEQGVIPKTSIEEIPNLVVCFQGLSAQKLLTGPALVGVSSFKKMLKVSGLNDDQQKTFARLYAAHRTDMPTFWQAVKDALGPERARRLQVDGKLAFAAKALSSYFSNWTAIEDRKGQNAAKVSSHQRRADEWLFQYNLAAREVMQIGR